MVTTRIISMHINRSRTIAQCRHVCRIHGRAVSYARKIQNCCFFQVLRLYYKQRGGLEIPGGDRYYAANAGNADAVESRLREAGSDYILIESDISNEKAVKDIYAKAIE